MNVYITLDYELYLGNVPGTSRNCLIEPTTQILSVLNQYCIRSTIFVDTAYLCKLNEYVELTEEFNNVYSQLQHLSKDNHSIQLHIHPQWFYSSYDRNGWTMDFEHYKLSDCPLSDVEKMFTDGIEIIKEITSNSPMAFRAGGYSIQTFDGYANFLSKHNIKIDSSCLCSKSMKSKYQYYDYQGIAESNIYKFSNDICASCKNGQLLELPITTYKISPFLYAYKQLPYSLTAKRCGDGVGVAHRYPIIRKIQNRLMLFMSPIVVPATIDRKAGCVLLDIYKAYRRRGVADFTIIIHPKETTNHSLRFLEEFLDVATKDGCVFKTVEDLNSYF